MASRIRIAVDCMGGDHGLRTSIPAALSALSQFSDLDLTLVGDQQAIAEQLSLADVPAIDSARYRIVHADDVVAMSDKPSFALRKKKTSSMRIAIDLLQVSEVDAVVSAGNTGALMAMGCYVLKMLPGIARPAICSAVPSVNGHSYLLDLGANVDSCADHLHQFAIMGAALSSAVDGIDNPRIGLLNIGEEAMKGNEQVKLAARLIEGDSHLNYIGSVEGDGLFSGQADVIVCDGFVGNVALKACEGTASYIAGVVQAQFKRGWFGRAAALLAMPVLKRIFLQLNPQQYNGASFLGLQGVLVKSHGGSSAEGFCYAIAQARSEVDSNMLAMIDLRLAAISEQPKPI